MSDINKGYTKKKYRRKIPKTVRWYDKHRSEDKTFDKSEDEDMGDIEKGRGKDLAPRKTKGTSAPKPAGPRTQHLEHQQHLEGVISYYDKSKNLTRDEKADHKDHKKQLREHMRMNKSAIENEIDGMAKSMEDSTLNPNELVIRTIEDLGPEGLKKAMANLDDDQKILLKGVLEDMKKGGKGSGKSGVKKRDLKADAQALLDRGTISKDEHAQLSPKEEVVKKADFIVPAKKFITATQMGTEVETGSDDEDEKVAKQAESTMKNQGDNSPEGFEGQVIKSEDLEMKKSELIELKDKIIKSYNDAGLSYTVELIKSEMKKAMQSKITETDQTQGGKPDRSNKESVPAIEEAKNAKTIAKSLNFDKDETSLLKANTQGRNYHYSINAHYDQALAKSEETVEELQKSETEDTSICGLIEKGLDKSADSTIEEQMLKSQTMSGAYSESFNDEDLAKSMNMTVDEMNEILSK